MQVKMEFTNHNGVRKCPVPTGELVVTRVPRMGLMGVYRPVSGRQQVFVHPGKVRTLPDMYGMLVSEYRRFVGLDEIRSFV